MPFLVQVAYRRFDYYFIIIIDQCCIFIKLEIRTLSRSKIKEYGSCYMSLLISYYILLFSKILQR